jgi:hypothetical protein
MSTFDQLFDLDIDTRMANSFRSNFTDNKTLYTILQDLFLSTGDLSKGAKSVTHAQLLTLMRQGKLKPGGKYTITDYRAINPVHGKYDLVGNPDFHYGTIEPLSVKAKSTTELHPVAYSALHPNDFIIYDPWVKYYGTGDSGLFFDLSSVTFDLSKNEVRFGQPLALCKDAAFTITDHLGVTHGLNGDKLFQATNDEFYIDHEEGKMVFTGRKLNFGAPPTDLILIGDTANTSVPIPGLILRRTDLLAENSFPYDYRGCRFRRYKVNGISPGIGDGYFAALPSQTIPSGTIDDQDFIMAGLDEIQDFFGNYADIRCDNIVGLGFMLYQNYFGGESRNVTLGTYVERNRFAGVIDSALVITVLDNDLRGTAISVILNNFVANAANVVQNSTINDARRNHFTGQVNNLILRGDFFDNVITCACSGIVDGVFNGNFVAMECAFDVSSGAQLTNCSFQSGLTNSARFLTGANYTRVAFAITARNFNAANAHTNKRVMAQSPDNAIWTQAITNAGAVSQTKITP